MCECVHAPCIVFLYFVYDAIININISAKLAYTGKFVEARRLFHWLCFLSDVRRYPIASTRRVWCAVDRLAASVESLGWVTPGAATKGVIPLFFPENPDDLFSLQFCIVTPIYFLPKNRRPFLLIASSLSLTLISLGCHQPPPLEGVTAHLFTCPTSFFHYSL